MTQKKSLPKFPIPVVTELGIGSQEDDGLEYMVMPKGMDVFQIPLLPEPEDMSAYPNAMQTLHALIQMIKDHQQGEVVAPLTLLHLSEVEVNVINQVLGEGEVAATIAANEEQNFPQIDIQETVFVGVWRVLVIAHGIRIYDALEVATIPALIEQVAQQDAESNYQAQALPADMVNVPTIIHEVVNQSQTWSKTQKSHMVNLTLLPLSELDIAYIDEQLGTGRVTILSRGYGNCRIVNTCTPNTWRLVYYNSHDKVILNAIEVVDIPEVACAAEQDFKESLGRLIEVVSWLESES